MKAASRLASRVSLRYSRARAVSLAFSVVATALWLASVAYFGVLAADHEIRDVKFIPVWVFEGVGIFLFLCSITYTVLSLRALGYVSHVLSVMFSVSGGASLCVDIVKYEGREDEDPHDAKFLFHFGTVSLALIFHALAIAPWPYFKESQVINNQSHWPRSRQSSHRHFKDTEMPYTAEVALTTLGAERVKPRSAVVESHSDSDTFSESSNSQYEGTHSPQQVPAISRYHPAQSGSSDPYSSDGTNAMVGLYTKPQSRATRVRGSDVNFDEGEEEYVVNQLLYEDSGPSGGQQNSEELYEEELYEEVIS